jgi:hypothetical protein
MPGMRQEILKYLQDNKYNSDANLGPFLKQNFPSFTRLQVRDTILEMLSDGVIVGDRNTITAIFGRRQDLWNLMGDFDTNIVLLKIHTSGAKELTDQGIKEQEMSVNQAVIEVSKSTLLTNTSLREANASLTATNTSIRRLNTFLIYSNILALLNAAAPGVFIALTFLKDDGKDLQPIYTQLGQQRKLLDSMLQSEKGINSSLQTMAKDSVKKILVLKK